MSKIAIGGLDQYGAEPFEQQQFGTAGVEGVKCSIVVYNLTHILGFTIGMLKMLMVIDSMFD